MTLHFIRPEWFLALLPVSALLWYVSRKLLRQSGWQAYIAPHLMGALVTGQSQSQERQGLWLLGASLLLAVTALAGPAINKVPLPVFATGVARVLVMDMSISMYATDLVPNRVTQAKFRATDLINQTTEGDTALVAYAGDAFVISPMTRDKGTLLNLLPSLSPDIMPVLGSAPAQGIKEAIELLTHAGHLSGDIVLMTDGLDEVDEADIRRAMKDNHFRLAIYGFGTAQGAPMKLPDGSFVRGADNALVLPSLNSARLSDFAKSLGGIYIGAALDGTDLSRLNAWFAKDGEATETALLGDSWQDLGPYLALLLIVPALLAFRHGLVAILLVVLLPLGSPRLEAAPWQTTDQQAMDAFRQGDFKGAADGFERSDWKAVAQYRAGNYQEALKGFETDTSAKGLYNQGNALMQLGQYAQAASRYAQALAQDPEFAEARANEALAKQLAEQSQSQPQSSKDPQSQDNAANDQDSQPGDNGNQGSQDSSGGKEQDSQGQGEQQPQESENSSAQSPADKQPSGQDTAEQEPSQESQDQGEGEHDKGDKQEDGNASREEPSSPEQDAPMSADVKEPASAAAQANADELSSDDRLKSPMSASQDEQPSQGDEAQALAAQASAVSQDGNELPPELKRALKAVDDDPSVLLRNKMKLEYQLRRERGEHRQEKQKW